MMLSCLQIKNKKERIKSNEKTAEEGRKRLLLNPSTFSSGVTQNPHKSTYTKKKKKKKTGLPFPQVSKVVFRKLN